MMQHVIVLANGSKNTAVFAHRQGYARLVAAVFQIRTVDQVMDRADPVQIDRAVTVVHRLIVQAELAHEKLQHVLWTLIADFQPHRLGVAALLQLALQRARQILDFFLVDK